MKSSLKHYKDRVKENLRHKSGYRYLFLFLIFVSGAVDTITFLMLHFKNTLQGYESNPIFIFSSYSIVIPILFKWLVLICLSLYVAYLHNDNKDYMKKYIICFGVVLCIVLQFVGAMTNVNLLNKYEEHVTTGETMPEPATDTQNSSAYLSFVLWYGMYPFVLGASAFLIFKRLVLCHK